MVLLILSTQTIHLNLIAVHCTYVYVYRHIIRVHIYLSDPGENRYYNLLSVSSTIDDLNIFTPCSRNIFKQSGSHSLLSISQKDIYVWMVCVSVCVCVGVWVFIFCCSVCLPQHYQCRIYLHWCHHWVEKAYKTD